MSAQAATGTAAGPATVRRPATIREAALRSALDAIRLLPPRAAAAAALPFFMSVGPRRTVQTEEEQTHLISERSRIPVPGLHGKGGEAVAYAWGSGDRPVLLVHGWGGRASQFAALVQELRYAGVAAVAFDAPAHGDAPGRGTYILDFIGAMAELERRHGPFRAVVAHSFGSLAALVAISEGLVADRVVTVSGMGDADHLVASFAAAAGLGPAAAAALRERFARRIFPLEPDVYGRFSAVQRPLPASVPLLVVHDAADRRVPLTEADRLVAANAGHASQFSTRGLGHQRILADERVLAEITRFVAG
ncbi:alpha/beta hydrolase [Sinomonas sp. ASV486]|uniref:alpha/beta hydrolase n=1 Tax=Sinomonas sp. ASV486 TaxID=3051170 RepID=UPI0027DC5F43|nr:alpha/beta hydrolase [Sinomonas sp. ASV486]